LAGTVAVSKAVAKSGIPSLQKAGLILGSSIVAGAAQAVISSTSGYFNGASSASTITSATSSFVSNNNISKLVGNSPLFKMCYGQLRLWIMFV
jgi:hypothetical protein